MGFRKWLGLEGQGASTPRDAGAETETVREIVRSLEALPPEQARYLAAFAYVLARVARSDLSVSEDETRTMERIVQEIGGLDESQAVLVVQIAKSQNQWFGGTENFLVTREFAGLSSDEQKRALVECLFAVSAADRSITSAEETEIRKIASELGLSHGDFIAAKHRYRDFLAVLGKAGGGGSAPESDPAS